MLISSSWTRDASCRLISWHALDAPSAARAPALAPWWTSVCSSVRPGSSLCVDRCVLPVRCCEPYAHSIDSSIKVLFR